jgi:cold-inducible RNA-binding protein
LYGSSLFLAASSLLSTFDFYFNNLWELAMNEPKIYVGNLSYSVTEQQLSEYFSKFGEVTDVKVITDRATGRSKGFAFVTFASNNAVNTAVEKANGEEFEGRRLKVNVAKDGERSGGGGGHNGGGGRRQRAESDNRGGW